MHCHNRKRSRYGKIKKELLVILSLKDDKGEQRYCQVAPRCLYLDDYKNLTDGIDGNKRLAFYLDWWSSENEEKAVEIPAYFEFTGETLDSIASAQISDIKTQLYAGKAITPSVTVTLNGKKLKKGTDYTVSYANNTKAGSTASVIITGKGKTFYGISTCVCYLAEAILSNKTVTANVTSIQKTRYGEVCLSKPSVISSEGINFILPLKLSKQEEKLYENSILAMRSVIERLANDK